MKKYFLSFSLGDLKFQQAQFEAFIATNKYIDSWAYVFPGSFFIKSNANFETLWRSIHNFLGGNLFVIAEISSSHLKTNGTINTDIWSWLRNDGPDALTSLLPYIEKQK